MTDKEINEIEERWKGLFTLGAADTTTLADVARLIAEVRRSRQRIDKAIDYARKNPLPSTGHLLFLLGYEGEIKT